MQHQTSQDTIQTSQPQRYKLHKSQSFIPQNKIWIYQQKIFLLRHRLLPCKWDPDSASAALIYLRCGLVVWVFNSLSKSLPNTYVLQLHIFKTSSAVQLPFDRRVDSVEYVFVVKLKPSVHVLMSICYSTL